MPPLEIHRRRTASIAAPSGPTSHQRIGGRGAAAEGAVVGRGCWEGKELTRGTSPVRALPDHVAGRLATDPCTLRTRGAGRTGVVAAAPNETLDDFAGQVRVRRVRFRSQD